jgi:NADPH-dependent curcumin reductase CurA
MQYDAIELQAYNAASPADAAQVVQKTVQQPGQGEVLVQMKYAGVRPGCCVLLLLCMYMHSGPFLRLAAHSSTYAGD